jgi:hypothetical protein
MKWQRMSLARRNECMLGLFSGYSDLHLPAWY